MGGLKDLIRNGLLALVVLTLAACDAGPSAVLHDGEGKSASKPVNVAQAPVKPSRDDEAETSMPIAAAPIAAAPAEDHTDAPHYGAALKAATGAAAAITDTRYGDWPLWSKNRKYSADDNAHYQFEKHGAEVGAKTFERYLVMVHGFIHAPPPGTQTLTRKNGDTLFYDPKGNVFAVMTKAGAPRTLFRPDNGAAYWDQQKQIEADRRTATTNPAAD